MQSVILPTNCKEVEALPYHPDLDLVLADFSRPLLNNAMGPESGLAIARHFRVNPKYVGYLTRSRGLDFWKSRSNHGFHGEPRDPGLFDVLSPSIGKVGPGLKISPRHRVAKNLNRHS